MKECSEKQRNLLKKYISDENIKLLEYKKSVSSFIELILKTENRHFLNRKRLCINIESKCNIYEIDNEKIIALNKYINDNKEKYSNRIKYRFNYEYSFEIPKYKQYHVFSQTSFVGHSNISSEYNIAIDDDCNMYIGDYNILVELGVYNLQNFMLYLKNNIFKM
ncbi:hypothetical protein DVV91_10275 [Clostridium botulinum]|uniref:hypothetical protein n=1 Tax=Clostridium botulinum TaxID=1491 RepID=UPI00196794E1|nr:hypothetical protein [Clostridium botulinum]MBN1074728.1 hypothetical protein [Clostridium botulinum]